MKPFLCCLILLAATLCASTASADWPQFRGPHGDGTADSKKLPATWSETNHVKWATPVHGRAWSSPVILDGQVWITTATENGTELFAVSLDAKSGAIKFDGKLFDVVKPQFAHKFNTYGSPSPVIEKGRVYVTFGSPGTACLDTKTGKTIWTRTDFVCNHYRGAGSSPILYKNLLLMNFDGSDHQFVVALNKQTGKTVWQVQRSVDYEDLLPDGKVKDEGDFRKGFSTPHVIELQGKPVMLSLGAKAGYGYDPLTGREYFRVEEKTAHSAGTRPLYRNGLIIYPTGFSRGQLLAIRPGPLGDKPVVINVNAPGVEGQTNSPWSLVWRQKRNVPNKPSVQPVGDLLFMVDDGGVASCIETPTGAELWRERIGGNYSASPIAANGLVYFFSEEGKCAIVEAGRTFKKVAENTLGDGFMASPAVTGDALILRSRTSVYRIEN